MAKTGFEVRVPMKNYLKKYLENKFGSPVQFPRDCVEKVFLLALLARPSRRYDLRLKSSRYPGECTIIIDEDEFKRYGFELTKTNAVAFNSLVEKIFKEKMRFYIMMHLRSVNQLSCVIERFRDEFNIGDDELTFDGIKKDFQRYTKRNNINVRDWVGRKKITVKLPHSFDLSKS